MKWRRHLSNAFSTLKIIHIDNWSYTRIYTYYMQIQRSSVLVMIDITNMKRN